MAANSKTSFKKLSLFDLAVARVKNTKEPVHVQKGDIVEIVEPFVQGQNFLGLVVDCDKSHMKVYHSDMRKTVTWSRLVNCKVHPVH